MDLGIKGKSALVAASSKGLGKAIALELAREGARVIITSRKPENLSRAAEEIRALGAEVQAFRADLTVKEDIDNLIKKALDVYGSIDILVTNAGGPPPGTFEDFNDEDWLKAFNLTFLSAQRLIKGVLPHMKEKKWGRIIGLTSVSVKQPLDNLVLSNAIRSAVVGLFKTLSRELAPYNILVTALLLGSHAPRGWFNWREVERHRRAYLRMKPSRKWPQTYPSGVSPNRKSWQHL